MKAFSIEWHKQCLENQKLYLEEQKKRRDRLAQECEQGERAIEFYEDQIEEAIKRKKPSFDAERFLKVVLIKKGK